MRIIISLVLLNFILNVYGQMTIKITSVPLYYTPTLDTIFITGNFNNWNAGDTAWQMTNNHDGTYQISFSLSSGANIEYKFTRGSWDNVETQSDGSFLQNRTAIYTDGATLNCQVLNWNDLLGSHTATGNTGIIDLDFFIPELGRTRRIWAYLPPDYYNSNNSYPVLYMQDGQNLFDVVYAFGSEWNVDESMQALFNSFSPSAIIVGIDNGEAERLNEYSPWVNTEYGGGQGEAYSEFIVNTLKPFIDATFRTLPDREFTGIMGSSMGGLISFYSSISNQNVFSKAGIFSPSFWFSDSIYSFISQTGPLSPMRLYFLAGDQESSSMIPNINSVMNALSSAGFSGNEMNLKTVPGGQHAEWFWASEFSEAFQWLFDGVNGMSNIQQSLPIAVFNSNNKTISLNDNTDKSFYEVFNIQGQQVCSGIANKTSLDFSFLEKGIYFFRYKGFVVKIIV